MSPPKTFLKTALALVTLCGHFPVLAGEKWEALLIQDERPTIAELKEYFPPDYDPGRFQPPPDPNVVQIATNWLPQVIAELERLYPGGTFAVSDATP